jgi:hypothetical protein
MRRRDVLAFSVVALQLRGQLLCARSRASGHESEQEHVMRKVIRGYGKDKNLNLILIGTIPVPHSKDKPSPAARRDKRYLVRQGATIFKKETGPIKVEPNQVRPSGL